MGGLSGARIGDMFMSLIHTCELNQENPFDYLTELFRHPGEVAAHPERFLPWNYRQTIAELPAADWSPFPDRPTKNSQRKFCTLTGRTRLVGRLQRATPTPFAGIRHPGRVFESLCSFQSGCALIPTAQRNYLNQPS